MSCCLEQWALLSNHVVQPSLETVQCDDGDIRIFMGETGGPLEVCVDKRWARVCNGRQARVDTTAAVACRQLGYDSGKMYRMNAAYFIKC